jgi:transposase-like protein
MSDFNTPSQKVKSAVYCSVFASLLGSLLCLAAANGKDLLDQILFDHGRDGLQKALEMEADAFMEENQEKLPDGTNRFVRNGHQLRTIYSSSGEICVKIPRILDRNKNNPIKFQSQIIPRYQRRTMSMSKLIVEAYMGGVSSTKIEKLLTASAGGKIKNASSPTVSRLKSSWFDDEILKFINKDFSGKDFVVIFCDGVYLHAYGEEKNICMLAAIGIDSDGNKEILRIEKAESEGTEEWVKFFDGLRKQGLGEPAGVVGDGGAGLWAAVDEIFPKTHQMICWTHKDRDVISLLPRKKSIINCVVTDLKEIYNASCKILGMEAFERFKNKYETLYPKAVKTVENNLSRLFNFYEFPEEMWSYIKTSNAIESIFSIIKSRVKGTRGCCRKDNLVKFAQILAIRAEGSMKNYDVFKGQNIPRNNLGDGAKVSDASNEIANESITTGT